MQSLSNTTSHIFLDFFYFNCLRNKLFEKSFAQSFLFATCENFEELKNLRIFVIWLLMIPRNIFPSFRDKKEKVRERVKEKRNLNSVTPAIY